MSDALSKKGQERPERKDYPQLMDNLDAVEKWKNNSEFVNNESNTKIPESVSRGERGTESPEAGRMEQATIVSIAGIEEALRDAQSNKEIIVSLFPMKVA